MCHRPIAKPGTVRAEAEQVAGMDEGKDQAGSWVLKEKWWQWGRVGVYGVLLQD